MEKPTIEKIDEVVKELGDAMKEFLDIDKKETEIKIAKIKAHDRFLRAKENFNSLKIEY